VVEGDDVMMHIVYEICCGIDVHAKTVVACLFSRKKKEIRTFSTMTDDLLKLLDWLQTAGCTHIAIESTSIYWKPVFNILEGSITVILVNARHIKAVPGRKTDVRDCEWIADLLRHGLLKPSFIPPLEIRELRDLTRYRQSLKGELARIANRVIKEIESGNIKLRQVASDALGGNARKMLKLLATGETDVELMANLAKGKLKSKMPDLLRSLNGKLTASQRWVLNELLARYEEIESAITRVDVRIAQELTAHPEIKESVDRIDELPGIGPQNAVDIISEIGTDMSAFPSHHHLASWAAVCPGNNESAGKRRSGKTRKGNTYLRTSLVQAAWAASHTKNTYLSAQYHRFVKRLGKKKSLIAVAHTILIIIYEMISRNEHFHELGGNYFELHQNNKQNLRDHLIKKLNSLGLRVTVEELNMAT
jgi:transposase